jgi:hypothetical protein
MKIFILIIMLFHFNSFGQKIFCSAHLGNVGSPSYLSNYGKNYGFSLGYNFKIKFLKKEFINIPGLTLTTYNYKNLDSFKYLVKNFSLVDFNYKFIIPVWKFKNGFNYNFGFSPSFLISKNNSDLFAFNNSRIILSHSLIKKINKYLDFYISNNFNLTRMYRNDASYFLSWYTVNYPILKTMNFETGIFYSFKK